MSTDTLRELSMLCQQLRDAETAAEAKEQELKACKATARRIAEEDIPGLMAELGVQKIVLESGDTITVAADLILQTLVDNKPKCWAWLEENGYGSLIDTDVSVHFSREEKENAEAFTDRLLEEGLHPELKQGVNASRLKAFIKERVAAEAAEPPAPDKVFPLDLFGAIPLTVAKIKRPKGS